MRKPRHLRLVPCRSFEHIHRLHALAFLANLTRAAHVSSEFKSRSAYTACKVLVPKSYYPCSKCGPRDVTSACPGRHSKFARRNSISQPQLHPRLHNITTPDPIIANWYANTHMREFDIFFVAVSVTMGESIASQATFSFNGFGINAKNLRADQAKRNAAKKSAVRLKHNFVLSPVTTRYIKYTGVYIVKAASTWWLAMQNHDTTSFARLKWFKPSNVPTNVRMLSKRVPTVKNKIPTRHAKRCRSSRRSTSKFFRRRTVIAESAIADAEYNKNNVADNSIM